MFNSVKISSEVSISGNKIVFTSFEFKPRRAGTSITSIKAFKFKYTVKYTCSCETHTINMAFSQLSNNIESVKLFIKLKKTILIAFSIKLAT